MAADRIQIGGAGPGYGEPRDLLLRYANRHGLITGATGTGKTVTLQILAEGLSAAGVPVVVQDVKGMRYNPLTRSCGLGRDVDVNYLLHASKP